MVLLLGALFSVSFLQGIVFLLFCYGLDHSSSAFGAGFLCGIKLGCCEFQALAIILQQLCFKPLPLNF
jgi:hypothetical protein